MLTILGMVFSVDITLRCFAQSTEDRVPDLGRESEL